MNTRAFSLAFNSRTVFVHMHLCHPSLAFMLVMGKGQIGPCVSIVVLQEIVPALCHDPDLIPRTGRDDYVVILNQG